MKKKYLILIAVLVFALIGITAALMNAGKKAPAPVAPVKEELFSKKEIIGKSVEGREIAAYTYGTGEKHVVFVGGMHGGYEWNSVLLANKFIEYIKANPDFISKNLTVTVIPNINPDGVYVVTGKEGIFTAADATTSKEVLASGRFNANKVDLNRNFDCKWKSESTWQNKKVSAGTKAFSEPEAQALKDFVEKNNPDAFVFWHSQANAVYASECKDGILAGTLDIMNAYAKAAGYQAVKTFDAYEITGDAEGWLASINIPAITVELKTHETIEWDKNLAGIKAILEL